ncbi:MAG: pilus assembly protein TadG-related protein [Anaerolineales bacterium]
MKSNNLFERGQALIIIALAAIGLFAIVGVGIDGSAKFSDRRHAQNAADTAALAAALAKIDALTVGLSDNPTTCPPSSGSPSAVCAAVQLAGLDRAASNGYNNNLTSNIVKIYSPPISGPYTGNTKYVQVIITSYVNTFFARIIGIPQTKNEVQAVTFTRQGGPMFNGASIASYNPDTSSGCSGSLRVGGSSTITLTGGGLWLNSDEPDCALEQQGGCPSSGNPLLVINGGGISSAGNNNVDFDACVNPIPSISYNNTQLKIPEDVDMPDRPAECSQTSNAINTPAGSNTWHITPGYYTDFPQNGIINNNKNIIMEPGVYCVNGDVHWSGATFSSLDGTSGVTIYITKGHDFSLSINSPISLDASNSGEYKGYLIIVETDFTGARGSCTINGGTYLTMSGTIFAPYCDVTINGDNNSSSTVNLGTQVIGWNVTLNGSSTVNFNYVPADNAQNQKRVGLMK